MENTERFEESVTIVEGSVLSREEGSGGGSNGAVVVDVFDVEFFNESSPPSY